MVDDCIQILKKNILQLFTIHTSSISSGMSALSAERGAGRLLIMTKMYLCGK